MSEHIIPRDEWKYDKDINYQRGIDKQELEALRAELKAAQAELDRMRKALEDIRRHQQIVSGSAAKISAVWLMASAALNPQPAQPESK